jgi:hypothetical protein
MRHGITVRKDRRNIKIKSEASAPSGSETVQTESHLIAQNRLILKVTTVDRGRYATVGDRTAIASALNAAKISKSLSAIAASLADRQA